MSTELDEDYLIVHFFYSLSRVPDYSNELDEYQLSESEWWEMSMDKKKACWNCMETKP